MCTRYISPETGDVERLWHVGGRHSWKAGEVFPLVSGLGRMFGTFRLENMTRTETHIVTAGLPLKIAYDLDFVYQDDAPGDIWSLWP